MTSRPCRWWQSSATTRRVALNGFGPIAAVVVALTRPVAAHTEPVAGTAESTIPAAVVVCLAVALSLVGGVAVSRWAGAPHAARLLRRPVAVLLVFLGVSGLVAAADDDVLAATVGAFLGIAVTAWTLRRGVERHVGCDDATLGAVAVHRCLEGFGLAVASASGVAFGVAGALLFVGHATAETCVVGGLYATESGRRRAFVAVAAVQFAFVLGAAVGVVALATVPQAVSVGLLAAVGSVLAGIGLTLLVRQTEPEPRRFDTPQTSHSRHR